MKISVLCLLLSIACIARGADVVIFSQPGGHATVANRVQQLLTKAGVSSQQLNVPDFLPSIFKKYRHQLAQYTVRNYPERVSAHYQWYMQNAELFDSIADLPNAKPYDRDRILLSLREANPKIVIVPFAPAMEFLEDLTRKGDIANLPIAYVPTDYGIQKYFSRQIPMAASMTFAPHPDWAGIALENGVPEEKITVTGIPANPKVFAQLDNREIQRLWEVLDFTPGIPTVVVASGSTGNGDLSAVIKSIGEELGAKKIQVLAATGHNRKLFDEISRHARSLHANVRIRVMGFDPNLPWYMKYVADAIVTKPGGLTTTEVALMNKPLILISPAIAQEADNLMFFTGQGMALSAEAHEAGKTLKLLLDSPDLADEIKIAQSRLATAVDDTKIVSWVTDTLKTQRMSGVEPYFSSREIKSEKGFRRIGRECSQLLEQLKVISDAVIKP